MTALGSLAPAAPPDEGGAPGLAPERAAALELAPPQDLAGEIAVAPEEARALRGALFGLLAALEEPDAARRLARVRLLLAALPPQEARPARVGATRIAAGKAEVEDFDRYFGVRRIEPAAPALSLARGLLTTAAGVLSLAARAPGLPREAIDRQVAGFACYARLLARICRLDPLP